MKNEQNRKKLANPDEMNIVLGNTLKAGVILSASVIAIGLLLFLVQNYSVPAETFLVYNSNKVPHGNFGVSLPSFENGLIALNPFSVIELGLLILLATPVARVFLSILLFHFEGDRKFVYITVMVFVILLFSILVVPFIPGT